VTEKRFRVVIADDNSTMRAVLRAALREVDYEVVGEATDGVATLVMVERTRPDIVCLDIVMPNTDGLQALRDIKEKFPATVVVMISGNADRESVQGAIAGGACGYILKPFNTARIIEIMKKAATLVPQPPDKPPAAA